MEEWSALFTLAALAGVLLMLLGAWLFVRALRGRKTPSTSDDDRRTHPSGPLR